MDLFTYPLFEATWAADYPDPDNFLSMFKVRSGNNRPKFKSPKYDEQIEVAKGLNSKTQREKIYFELQKQLLEEQAALVPLYYDTNVALVANRVKGVELNPLNYLELRRVKIEGK
jgi:ABC-type oligopeptide transport system substrate-binding subunit